MLPFVAGLPLVDHHCHGVIRRDVDRRGFEALLTEAGDAYGSRPARREHGAAAAPADAPDIAERAWAGTDTPAGTGPGPGAPGAVTLSGSAPAKPRAVTLSGSGPAKPGAVTLFDSQIGLAVRRWCPPVLGLPAHTGPDKYLHHRAALGHAEVSRRFLRAAGLAALCVDTGFEPKPLLSPPMLLHNYPYHREAGYLAQVFPHVYVDAGLATHNLGHRATAPPPSSPKRSS